MSDARKDGLAQFADVMQRARIETHITRSLEELHQTLADARDSLNTLEGELSDILFGNGRREEPLSCF